MNQNQNSSQISQNCSAMSQPIAEQSAVGKQIEPNRPFYNKKFVRMKTYEVPTTTSSLLSNEQERRFFTQQIIYEAPKSQIFAANSQQSPPLTCYKPGILDMLSQSAVNRPQNAFQQGPDVRQSPCVQSGLSSLNLAPIVQNFLSQPLGQRNNTALCGQGNHQLAVFPLNLPNPQLTQPRAVHNSLSLSQPPCYLPNPAPQSTGMIPAPIPCDQLMATQRSIKLAQEHQASILAGITSGKFFNFDAGKNSLLVQQNQVMNNVAAVPSFLALQAAGYPQMQQAMANQELWLAQQRLLASQNLKQFSSQNNIDLHADALHLRRHISQVSSKEYGDPQKVIILKEARPLINRLEQLLPQLESMASEHGASPQDRPSQDVMKANAAQMESRVNEELVDIDVIRELAMTEGEACEIKHFEGIPNEWHETIKVWNRETKRTKLYFRCKYTGCESVFRKSCNLRDHFRKHTMQRPYQCDICQKYFTQSGNLGRHLKNVHQITRAVPQTITQQIISKKKIKTKKRKDSDSSGSSQ